MIRVILAHAWFGWGVHTWGLQDGKLCKASAPAAIWIVNWIGAASWNGPGLSECWKYRPRVTFKHARMEKILQHLESWCSRVVLEVVVGRGHLFNAASFINRKRGEERRGEERRGRLFQVSVKSHRLQWEIHKWYWMIYNSWWQDF